MARKSEFSTTCGDGAKAVEVGYSSKTRNGLLAVTFCNPEGVRLEKMTKCKRKDVAYHNEAARIIARAYQSAFPDLNKVKWSVALDEVERTAPTLRPKTLVAFRRAVHGLNTIFAADSVTTKKPASPSDITPELAARFARLFLTTTYTRGKSTIQRKRTPVTLSYYVRSLSALWGQFRDLGYVSRNPWSDVKIPQSEKKDKYVPTEDETNRFFRWIETRYPQWQRLHALLKLKLLSGCRTADIVQLKTAQIANGQLVFHPSQTKTKTGRRVPLPDDLRESLQRVAGKVWLWDGWNEDCKKWRPSANALPTTFKPDTVRVVLQNIFREYSDANRDVPRLAPHALRRRAITIMVTATQSVDLTAQALGLNAQTARSYYLDSQRAFNTADAFKLATPLLLPKSPTIPPLCENEGEQNGTSTNN